VKLNIDDSFVRSLPADPELTNASRQVMGAGYSFVRPLIPSHPQLIHFSKDLAVECGLNPEDIASLHGIELLSGKIIYPGTQPYAMCYGGHQFGHWAGQLGDGRAINLFEHIHQQQRFTFQLKGAGPTPYSRKADGLAVLRSSIREYLCSEAMHYLGIPTTRALSLISTGDTVWRDMLYDGNPKQEKGAIVCRIAPSFIRFGNFEIFASRKDYQNLQRITDYTIQHFYPLIEAKESQRYLDFFREVCDQTLQLILQWQRVGFVHGVMNTDNMSILGLTIDYGPYGWLEDYNPDWTPNTTDAQGRRYRFGNQPNIALWNLVQLANALYPLIEDIPALEALLDDYTKKWDTAFIHMSANKLGFLDATPVVNELYTDLTSLMLDVETDYTIFFRQLSHVEKSMDEKEILQLLLPAFYTPEIFPEDIHIRWKKWIRQYQYLIQQDIRDDEERKEYMHLINPKYVLRNYMAQLAIDAAEKGDYSIIDELHILLQNPYKESPQYQKWYAKRPDWAKNKVGCSMLSCSS